jgi:Cu2+-exporting ATPase/Cu+-exporting ATPase
MIYMTKKIITVEGMHCMHCASGVEKAIEALDGVKAAKVNLDKKTCTAKLTGDVTDEAIVSAVKEAGFEVIGIYTADY